MMNQRRIIEAMMETPASRVAPTKAKGTVSNSADHMDVMGEMLFGRNKPIDPRSTDLTGGGVEVLLGATPQANPARPVNESIESVLIGRRFDESSPFATVGEMEQLNLRIDQASGREREQLEGLRNFYTKSNQEALAAHAAGPPMGSNPIVLVSGQGRTTTSQDMNPVQRVVSRTAETNRRLDADYAPYIGREDEIGVMAQNARKGEVPVEDFLNTRYGPEVTVPEQRTKVSGPLEPGRGDGSYFDAYDTDILVTPEHKRAGTIRDVISSEEAQVASKKSNTTKSNNGSNQVSSKKAGYEGFQSGGLAMNFIERHGGAAMVGAGAGMMSEGEVSAGGAARGAMFGVMGGKAARMVTGSMKGGAVNALGRSVGGKVSGMGAEGGAANRAGQYLQETMEGFAGSKSQEAMRVATFAGAGLAGFSMGRDRNHSRGMNSGRGSRF